MLPSVNFLDKNLIFGIWFPSLQNQLDLSGWVTKMNFFWGTLLHCREFEVTDGIIHGCPGLEIFNGSMSDPTHKYYDEEVRLSLKYW